MVRTGICAAALCLLSAGAGARAPRDQATDELLKTANDYFSSFTQRGSGVSLEERYTLTEVSTGQMTVPQRITSEIIFLNINGRLMSIRDALSINGAKTREPESRIIPLLVEPTMAGWQKAQQFAAEGHRYFASELILRMNDPLLALQFIQPAHHAKFTYKIDGKKKVNNVDTVGLRFEETKGELTKYVMGTRGNGYLVGRLWVEPATGAVHGTELSLESRTESARINVTFAPSADLKMLLPSKSAENYDTKPMPDGMINRGEGGYGARQAFQVNAQYDKAKLTPIDLSKIRQ